MKGKNKLITIVFLFAIVAISGCVGENKTTAPPTTTTTVAPVTTTTVPPVSGDNVTTTTVPEPTGERERVIVDAAWVKENIDNIVPVYAGSDQSAKDQSTFATGHIPGSVFLDCFKYCYKTEDAYPGNVVDQARWENYLSELGISNDDTILVYAKLDNGDWSGAYAARAWWVFKYYGHEKVYYLDGGMDTWDGPLEAAFEMKERPATTYKATPNPDLIATADYVAERINDPNVAIVSTRPVPGMNPLDEVNRKKRIPNDITIDWVEHHEGNNQANKFKPREEIERIYSSKGVTKDKEVITYCETGTRAANTMMVLYDLGYKVRDYAGSMSEWRELNSQDPEKYPFG